MDVAGTKSARAEGRVSRNSVRKMLVGRRQDKQIRAHHGEHMEPINVVLVHGGWADGSSWSKVIPLLQDKGFNVTAAQIPLTSIEDDVAITKRLLTAQNGPTVLVGHSYGGIVVSDAGNGSPNVKALVYIAAFALDEGESIEALGWASSCWRCSDSPRRKWISLDQPRRVRAGVCFRRRPNSRARHPARRSV